MKHSRSFALICCGLLCVASARLVCPSLAHADALDEIQRRGKLHLGRRSGRGRTVRLPRSERSQSSDRLRSRAGRNARRRAGSQSRIQARPVGRSAADAGQPDRRGAQRLRAHSGPIARLSLHTPLLRFRPAVDGPARQPDEIVEATQSPQARRQSLAHRRVGRIGSRSISARSSRSRRLPGRSRFL